MSKPMKGQIYCVRRVDGLREGFMICLFFKYRQTSNISRPLVGNTIVNHSDVNGALPVGPAPTTSSFST